MFWDTYIRSINPKSSPIKIEYFEAAIHCRQLNVSMPLNVSNVNWNLNWLQLKCSWLCYVLFMPTLCLIRIFLTQLSEEKKVFIVGIFGQFIELFVFNWFKATNWWLSSPCGFFFFSILQYYFTHMCVSLMPK